MQSEFSPLEKRVLWFFPSAPVLTFVLVFWMSLLFMPLMLNGDGDIGRHLVTGSFILTTGTIPTQDVFSHTMSGQPLVPTAWLSEVLFALSFRAAGLNGVAWLTALVLAATYALLTFALRRVGVSVPWALAGGIGAAVVGALHALTRPHIFSWLLFIVFLIVLEEYRKTGRRLVLWLLLPLMVIWVNLHTVFVAGLVLVAMYDVGAVLERETRRAMELSALFVGLILASFVNPAGPVMLTHTVGFLQTQYVFDVTSEYASPNFHTYSVWPFAAMILFSIIVIARAGRRLAWTPLILIGGWTLYALYSVRNVPLSALVTLFLLTPAAEALLHEWRPSLSRLFTRTDLIDRAANGWVMGAAGVVMLVGLEWSGVKLDVRGSGNVFDSHVFPVAAVDWLQASPPVGNMFDEFTWGGYLIYRMWPQEKVFIDGWTDFYGDALTREYHLVLDVEPGWDKTLTRYDVRWVIVPPTRPLAVRLDDSPGWTRVYEDGTAGIWVRK